MAPDCEHALCELIGGTCSLASGRSRGCTPGLSARTIAPEVLEEVRALVDVIEARDPRARDAAVRLAEIIRREARDDRSVLAQVRDEEPEVADALARLTLRRR